MEYLIKEIEELRIDHPVSSYIYMHGELFIYSKQSATMDACYLMIIRAFILLCVWVRPVYVAEKCNGLVHICAFMLAARSLEIVCD